LIDVVDEIHPAMAGAVFVRDRTSTLEARSNQSGSSGPNTQGHDGLEIALAEEQTHNATLALELGVARRERDIEIEARAAAEAERHAAAKAALVAAADRDNFAQQAAELAERVGAEVQANMESRDRLAHVEATLAAQHEAAAKAALITMTERDELNQRLAVKILVSAQGYARCVDVGAESDSLPQALGSASLSDVLMRIDNLLAQRPASEWEADLAAAQRTIHEAVQAREQALLAWHDEIRAKAEIELALAAMTAAQAKMAARCEEHVTELAAKQGELRLATEARDVWQERSETLESAQRELLARQFAQHEKLLKAEAQIELIKDLLLREAGL
jgi:hypothetical protein